MYVVTGLSSLGVPWHTQILADQLTLFQPDYAHLITTGTPGFSDLPKALSNSNTKNSNNNYYWLFVNIVFCSK